MMTNDGTLLRLRLIGNVRDPLLQRREELYGVASPIIARGMRSEAEDPTWLRRQDQDNAEMGVVNSANREEEMSEQRTGEPASETVTSKACDFYDLPMEEILCYDGRTNRRSEFVRESRWSSSLILKMPEASIPISETYHTIDTGLLWKDRTQNKYYIRVSQCNENDEFSHGCLVIFPSTYEPMSISSLCIKAAYICTNNDHTYSEGFRALRRHYLDRKGLGFVKLTVCKIPKQFRIAPPVLKTPEVYAPLQYTCPVCFECGFEWTFECGHMFCGRCMDKLKERKQCPVCRAVSDKVIRLYYNC
jgi:C3HC4-type zinc finger (RING finger) protein